MRRIGILNTSASQSVFTSQEF